MLGLTEQTINDLLLKPMYFMSEFLLDYVENIIACNEVRLVLVIYILFIRSFKLRQG